MKEYKSKLIKSIALSVALFGATLSSGCATRNCGYVSDSAREGYNPGMKPTQSEMNSGVSRGYHLPGFLGIGDLVPSKRNNSKVLLPSNYK